VPISRSAYERILSWAEAGHGSTAARSAGLKKLGAGSSREAYLVRIPGVRPFALKVLRPEAAEYGTQMERELQCFAIHGAHPLMPRMLGRDRSDTPTWAAFELLMPLGADSGSRSRFARATGIDWKRFQLMMDSVGRGVSFSKVMRDTWDRLRVLPRRQAKAAAFLSNLQQLVVECGLAVDEMALIHNWGTNGAGEVKVLDVGVGVGSEPEWTGEVAAGWWLSPQS